MKKITRSDFEAMLKAAHAQTIKAAPKTRSVVPCNFRSAGRLSNESARALTTMHESFARNATNSLSLYLGVAVEVKFITLSQLAVQDHISEIAATEYLLPYSIAPTQGKLLMEIDSLLLFPIIDLLLGGSGEALAEARELTEIDEELIQGVTSLVADHLASSWKGSAVTLNPGNSIKPNFAAQFFPQAERIVVMIFEVTLSGTSSLLRIVIPASFANTLLRNSLILPSSRGSGQNTAALSLRDRLFNCSLLVSTDLTDLRVPVRHLVDLKPGSFLNLNVSVKTPVRLTLANRELFEAIPVRCGAQKAAQLGLPSSTDFISRQNA